MSQADAWRMIRRRGHVDEDMLQPDRVALLSIERALDYCKRQGMRVPCPESGALAVGFPKTLIHSVYYVFDGQR